MEDPSQGGQLEETEKINVVPLADLTLVLLIILMVLSPMITQSMIHVATPSVKSQQNTPPPEEEKPPEPLLINLTVDHYALNNVVAADLPQLLEGLVARSEEDPRRPIVVSADNGVAVGRLVEMLDAIKNRDELRDKGISLLRRVEAKT